MSLPTLPDTSRLPSRRCSSWCAFLAFVPLLGAAPAAGQQPCPPAAEASAVPDSTTGHRASAALPCPPPVPAALRHARGGGRLAAVLGDSVDHLQHNAVNVAVLSTALMALLWALPEDFPRFYTKDPSLGIFSEAYTRPPLWNDGDWWAWNFIGHPLVGMQQYLMERNWGSSQLRSFAFSAAASLVWEYGFEAWIERPSVQDMLLTAPAGWVLGEAAYRLTGELRRNGFTTVERVIVLIVNPLHVLQHGFR